MKRHLFFALLAGLFSATGMAARTTTRMSCGYVKYWIGGSSYLVYECDLIVETHDDSPDTVDDPDEIGEEDGPGDSMVCGAFDTSSPLQLVINTSYMSTPDYGTVPLYQNGAWVHHKGLWGNTVVVEREIKNLDSGLNDNWYGLMRYSYTQDSTGFRFTSDWHTGSGPWTAQLRTQPFDDPDSGIRHRVFQMALDAKARCFYTSEEKSIGNLEKRLTFYNGEADFISKRLESQSSEIGDHFNYKDCGEMQVSIKETYTITFSTSLSSDIQAIGAELGLSESYSIEASTTRTIEGPYEGPLYFIDNYNHYSINKSRYDGLGELIQYETLGWWDEPTGIGIKVPENERRYCK